MTIDELINTGCGFPSYLAIDYLIPKMRTMLFRNELGDYSKKMQLERVLEIDDYCVKNNNITIQYTLYNTYFIAVESTIEIPLNELQNTPDHG